MLQNNFLVQIVGSGYKRQYGLVLFLEKVSDQQAENADS
jgi:hypothetical protein